MPGIIDDLAASEAAIMLADDRAILLDDDTLGIGMNIDRPSHRLGYHRIFVFVEADEERAARRQKFASSQVIVSDS
jgi:hypothetical protein